MTPTLVIVDSDAGIVSCDALWWALVSPDLEVVAVTVEAGVVPTSQGARNFAKVLHAAGAAGIPLAAGLDERFGPAPELVSPAGIHGEDGLGNSALPEVPVDVSAEPAHELIARLCAERPGEIVLVSLGPFANVARALASDPALVDNVAGLVVMGGAARPPGNALPLGEFNVAWDPLAARAMFLAPWRTPPLMVGLDVTHRATLTEAEFAVLEQGATPQARFMAAPMRFYRPLSAVQSEDGHCPSHDTLAVMSVAHPDLLTWEELPVDVDVAGGAAWGTTVVDFRARIVARLDGEMAEMARQVLFAGKSQWRVATDVDVDDFRTRIRAFYGG